MRPAAEYTGAALLLLAYVGLSLRWWTEADPLFPVLNVAGAGLLAGVAWAGCQIGFAVLNIVWCLAAIRSLIGLQAAGRSS